MSLLPGTRVGKYIIQRKLAEGGMAEIFLASSFGPEGFEKQVVIKRIRTNFADDAAFVEMFVSEARLVSKLNHANIVQIFDFDRHEDTFYIAMEYVRGRSLAQAHQRARELNVPLAPALAAQIIVEVARGLGFAHRLTEHGQPLGLVHRDVTPQNILISYEGAVKLTDFGIAKAGTRASTVGVLKGKFAYMSPEQSRGESVDSRTDIFALGITLWELLSGGRLFDADSDIAVLHAVQERAVVPPTTLNAAVDSALSDIVMRSLERDKAARFQTAQEMERALSRYLATTAAETDVGAWMHTLFPIESGRTESTEFREPRIPIRLEGGTGGGPVPAASNVLSTPPRPQLQSDAPPAGSSPSGTGWDAQTARTPVAQTLAREPATRTTAPPAREGKRGVFVALGAGLAGVLATLAVVLFLSPKQTVVRPALPVEAPPARPQQLLPPVVAKPAPEPPPPSIASAPAPARKPKPPAVHKHSAAKPALAPAAAAPVATPAPVVAKPLPPTGPGMLVLFVSPAGDVLIDGKFQRRQDGRAEYELTPGTHQLEVRGPPAWKKAIVVEASQKTWEWAYR